MGRNERTLRMMDNFMKHHNEGLSIPEIAEIYDLTPRLIYIRLQEIADKEGVSRDSLLEVIQSPHICSGWYEKPVEKIDTFEFEENASQVRVEMSKVQQNVRDTIKRLEAYEKALGRN